MCSRCRARPHGMSSMLARLDARPVEVRSPTTSTPSTPWSCRAASRRRCRCCSSRPACSTRRVRAAGRRHAGVRHLRGHDPARRARSSTAGPTSGASVPSTSTCAATPSAARSTRSRPTSPSTGLADAATFHAVFIRAPVVEPVGRRRRRAGDGRRPTRAVPPGPRARGGVPSRAGGRPAAPRALPRRGGVTMSGHSKWATIKHKKGANDKARGKLFAKVHPPGRGGGARGRGRPRHEPDAAHDVPEGPRRLGADRHDRAGRSSGAPASSRASPTSDHLRGLRPRRRGRAGRGAHRQPQPHRRRHPHHLLQARRLDGRAGRGGVAVRAQGQIIVRPVRRRGRAAC